MMIGKMHVGIFSVVGGSPVSLQLHSPDEISLFSFPGEMMFFFCMLNIKSISI